MHDVAMNHSVRSKSNFSSPSARSKEDHQQDPRSDNRKHDSGFRGKSGKFSSNSSKRKSPRIYSRKQLTHMLDMQDSFALSNSPIDTAFIATCLSKRDDEYVLEPSMLFIQPEPEDFQDIEVEEDESLRDDHEDIEELGYDNFLLTFNDSEHVSQALTVSSPTQSP
jgi:hypothetical protein